jgi:DNA-binding transcriptional MerR regulator
MNNFNYQNSNSGPLSHTDVVGGGLAASGLFSLIGELAERTGISPMAIRYYEREGLISPSRLGRLRTYGDSDERRLQTIIMLRRLGLSIVKIKSALALQEKENADTAAYAGLLQNHFNDLRKERVNIDAQINETASILSRLGIEVHAQKDMAQG